MTGQRIGHYDVKAELGCGGMGVVYRAEDMRLGRAVALKFLSASAAPDRAAVERLVREARVPSSLNHPNICTIYEIGEHGGLPFIAMELIEGETLAARIRGRPLPVGVLLDLGVQIADALDAAHRTGLIHRDLKPDNVIVTTRGQVKVLDFGLAKQLDADLETTVARAGLTNPGIVVGTIAYMSPEQARGEPLDARSDVFSFGLILFEMATGRTAFPGGTTAVIFDAILNRDAGSASRVAPGIPAALDSLIAKALAKVPAARPQSAREMFDELGAIKRALDSGAKPGSGSVAKAAPSIAVLPFSDLSPTHDQQYFCEGMAEEVTTILSSWSGLRVASRTSAARCREKGLDIAEIGEKLNVQTVLEGSVRKAGNRLRISVQLTSVADGFQLWAERYDRDLDDVFEIQEQIGRAIAEKLKIKLVDGEAEPVARRGTDNLEAYNLYLKGRYHWERRTRWSLKSALDCFAQAAALDPDYALAHAGLADCYLVMAIYGVRPVPDLLPEARRAVTRALDLDPELPEALHVMGAIKHWLEWDWASAREYYDRALARQPRLAITHGYRGILFANLGRPDDAAAEACRILELEPDSALATYVAAGNTYWCGALDRALDLCNRALEIDPSAGFALWLRALCLSFLGRHDEAIAAAEGTSGTLNQQSSQHLAGLGTVLARAGRTTEADRVIAQLQERATGEFVTPLDIADVYAAFPDRHAEACEWLERAYDAHSPFLIKIKTDPNYQGLRAEPRFQAIERRIGLAT